MRLFRLPFFREFFDIRFKGFRLHWFIDDHMHFVYLTIANRTWRFSRAGYMFFREG